MSFTTVSSKGQITLPSNMRSKLDIKPKDKIEITVRDGEIVLRRVPSFRSLRGSIPRKRGDSRKVMERAVAEHVTGEDK